MSPLELYILLAPKLGEVEAKALIEYIEQAKRHKHQSEPIAETVKPKTDYTLWFMLFTYLLFLIFLICLIANK
jgi:hypothetical protein